MLHTHTWVLHVHLDVKYMCCLYMVLQAKPLRSTPLSIQYHRHSFDKRNQLILNKHQGSTRWWMAYLVMQASNQSQYYQYLEQAHQEYREQTHLVALQSVKFHRVKLSHPSLFPTKKTILHRYNLSNSEVPTMKFRRVQTLWLKLIMHLEKTNQLGLPLRLNCVKVAIINTGVNP